MKLLDRWFGYRRVLKNVTPPAQQVLVLARLEADRLFHSFVGTEHLLLAMLLASDGAAAVKTVGIDPVALKVTLESRLRPGRKEDRANALPTTPRFMQVLRASAKEANLLGHDFLASEHIVLGLLRVPNGIAWQTLRNFPVALEEARVKVRSLLTVRHQVPNAPTMPTDADVTPSGVQDPHQP